MRAPIYSAVLRHSCPQYDYSMSEDEGTSPPPSPRQGTYYGWAAGSVGVGHGEVRLRPNLSGGVVMGGGTSGGGDVHGDVPALLVLFYKNSVVCAVKLCVCVVCVCVFVSCMCIDELYICIPTPSRHPTNTSAIAILLEPITSETQHTRSDRWYQTQCCYLSTTAAAAAALFTTCRHDM